MTYVIAEPCVDLLDKACIEECPVDCIYEGDRMLYIHPDECVDCGACEPVCPVEAIYYEDDVPDQWADYTKANVDFFDELGSPGGASKVGKVDRGRRSLRSRTCRRSSTTSEAVALPDFPWDSLAEAKARAAAHPGRHRRPVGRHARRPGPGSHPGRAGRSGRRRARLPDHARHPRAARGRSSARWPGGTA